MPHIFFGVVTNLLSLLRYLTNNSDILIDKERETMEEVDPKYDLKKITKVEEKDASKMYSVSCKLYYYYYYKM